MGLGFWPFQVSGESTENPGSDNEHTSGFEDIVSVGEVRKTTSFLSCFSFFLGFFLKKYKHNNKMILQSKDLEKVSYFVFQ